MAIPEKDSLLVGFSTNFSDRISATPLPFGFTAPIAAAFATKNTAWVDSYNALVAARSSGIQSKNLVSTKNACRLAMLETLRALYGAVQTSDTVSDADKNLLGVTIRSLPTSIPVPGVAPAADVVSVIGRTTRVRLHDAADASRPKPVGVVGAAICSFVGPVAPSEPSAYTWEGSTNKSEVDVTFPEGTEPGTVVWITAMWLNAKNQTGPACTPVQAVINYGMSAVA